MQQLECRALLLAPAPQLRGERFRALSRREPFAPCTTRRDDRTHRRTHISVSMQGKPKAAARAGCLDRDTPVPRRQHRPSQVPRQTGILPPLETARKKNGLPPEQARVSRRHAPRRSVRTGPRYLVGARLLEQVCQDAQKRGDSIRIAALRQLRELVQGSHELRGSLSQALRRRLWQSATHQIGAVVCKDAAGSWTHRRRRRTPRDG